VEDARESAAKPDNVVIPKPSMEQAEEPVGKKKKRSQHIFMMVYGKLRRGWRCIDHFPRAIE
jgi:hypothetical protein